MKSLLNVKLPTPNYIQQVLRGMRDASALVRATRSGPAWCKCRKFLQRYGGKKFFSTATTQKNALRRSLQHSSLTGMCWG